MNRVSKRMLERSRVMLSVQRALLGEVSDALFAVGVEFRSGERILIDAYFIGPPSAADIMNLDSVGGEVASDFPDVLVDVQKSDALTAAGVHMRDAWAFLRAGDDVTGSVRFIEGKDEG